MDALAAMPESEIDIADMPPITDWSQCCARPVLPARQAPPLSLRIDAHIIDWFQRQGQGYQTRMNSALRAYVERRRKRA
jgi:uncharacterized protein (DUF4415 family)